jgi:hypothetical protein
MSAQEFHFDINITNLLGQTGQNRVHEPAGYHSNNSNHKGNYLIMTELYKILHTRF